MTAATNEPSAPTETLKPDGEAIRYVPSTDRYTGGGLSVNDLLTDGRLVFRVTRRSGFTLGLDVSTPGGWKVATSRSVDPTSPEYRGDLHRYADTLMGGGK